MGEFNGSLQCIISMKTSRNIIFSFYTTYICQCVQPLYEAFFELDVYLHLFDVLYILVRNKNE